VAGGRARRPAGVAHDRLGLTHRGLGEPGQLTGDARNRRLGFVALLRAAQLELARDRTCPPPGGTAAVT
jgi:hypothetical protein